MKSQRTAETERVAASPPSRGAWIEMCMSAGRPLTAMGRPPRGGRGLKLNSGMAVTGAELVAPLAGGVD